MSRERSPRWVLDLKASDSTEPMMKRMGVSAFERKLAASTKLVHRFLANFVGFFEGTRQIAFELQLCLSRFAFPFFWSVREKMTWTCSEIKRFAFRSSR
jgi:hypothetical protein